MPKTTTKKPRKIALTPGEQLQVNGIIEAARVYLNLPKNPRETSLVKLGEEIIRRAKGNPANVEAALIAQGQRSIAEGPKQQANRIGSQIQQDLKDARPKEKGAHTSLGNLVAQKLREYLESNAGKKLPEAVIEAINQVTIPYYLNKGKQEHPGTREFEFLFEAPLHSSTTQFGFFYEAPSSSNAFYSTQAGTQREYKNQWLFEMPFLLEADYATSLESTFEVNVTSKDRRIDGENGKKHTEAMKLISKNRGCAGCDYERLIRDELKLKGEGQEGRNFLDAMQGKIPVEISLQEAKKGLDGGKRDQLKRYLKDYGKVIYVAPKDYAANVEKSLWSVANQLKEELIAEARKRKKVTKHKKLEFELIRTFS